MRRPSPPRPADGPGNAGARPAVVQRPVRAGPLGAVSALLWAVLLGGPASAVEPQATATGALQEGIPHVEATLLASVQTLASGGDFLVGVRLGLAPEWHVYWRNPGEAGLASEVTFTAEGLTFGPLQWPAPSVLRSPEGSIVTYGYSQEVVLWARAHASGPLGKTVRLSALADVLVCATECVPAKLPLSRVLSVGPRAVAEESEAALLAAAEARVPLPVEEARVRVSLASPLVLRAGEVFQGELSVTSLEGTPVPVADTDAFIPDVLPRVTSLVVQPAAGKPGRLSLRGRLVPEAREAPLVLSGVLRLQGRERAVDVTVPLGTVVAAEAQAQARTEAPPVAARGLGLVLVLAFVGGVLLNLMPCVFPVLALKAYGFLRTAQAGGARAAGHALAYTLGIVTSLLVLAAGVVALRAAGHAVGWGFQFQSPHFVAVLAALLVAFALNLFGVYRVGVPAGGLPGAVRTAEGPWRSAGEGVLAVVLATPCTAPFLGTAVGFAFAAPAWVVAAVFVAVGLGLALPFCALVLVPGLPARLPRPGPWMERTRQLLGFALLGTAVWLASVVGGLSGVDGLVRLLVFLVAVGAAAFVVGAFQDGGRAGLAWAAAALLLLATGAATLRFQAAEATVASHRWTPEAVAAELHAGRPVFVDFTADWCLTCKFNERTVLSRPSVQAGLASTRTRFLVADWTRPDARISAELLARQRAGVPMYLVYSPQRPESPEVLPELLSESMVVEALRRAAGQLSAQLLPARADVQKENAP